MVPVGMEPLARIVSVRQCRQRVIRTLTMRPKQKTGDANPVFIL